MEIRVDKDEITIELSEREAALLGTALFEASRSRVMDTWDIPANNGPRVRFVIIRSNGRGE